MDQFIVAFTGPLWLYRSIMSLKAIIDRQSILEQNNVLAV